jgi:1,4-dihydroxy-2-naphthoate octaprenyltransferase
VEPEQAHAHWLRIGWRLARPHTLTASFIPVLLGGMLGWRAVGRMQWDLLAAMLAASMLIQAATNMFNEYFDYVGGLDTAESVGIAGALTRDGVRPRRVLWGALALLAAATGLGVFLCLRTTWWLAAIGALCMAVGYLYTGGPWPIAATPLGELFAGGFMGSGIILLSCYLQRRAVTATDVLASIPSALLIAAILTANNIRDRVGDARNGRRTLAILLGHRRAVALLGALMAGANLWLAALCAAGLLPAWTLLALASLGPAAAALRIFARGGTPPEMMPAMVRVAQTNTVFGILLAAGLHIGVTFR